MKQLYRRLVTGIVLGVVVTIAFSLYGDINKLGENLSSFRGSVIAPVLGLAFLNYLIRFAKWSLFLRILKIRIPLASSASIYLSGLMMSITPGKIGEFFKAWLLRETHGVPITTSAPVVVTERVADLLALLVITITGLAIYRVGATALLMSVVLVLIPIGILTFPPAATRLIGLVGRLPGMAGPAGRLGESYQSMRSLVAPAPLTIATTMSIISWGAECTAFMLILQAIPGVGPVPLSLAAFIFAASTVAGVPSPGGLGLTEGGMVGLTMMMLGTSRPVAVTATIITRLCTLWFAVLVGMVALGVLRFRQRRAASAVTAQGEEVTVGGAFEQAD